MRYDLNTQTYIGLPNPNPSLFGVGGQNVFRVAATDSDIYLAGDFTTTTDGAVPLDRVARFDLATQTWHRLGSGIVSPSSRVRALVVRGDDLYVGGNFLEAGGVAETDRIARFDLTTSTWMALSDDIPDGNVLELFLTDEGLLYTGGSFSMTGPHDSARLGLYVVPDSPALPTGT